MFGSLATVGGLKVRFVHVRGCALNEAAAITELVIVEAVRTSDSGREAMWKPSDNTSGGGGVEGSVVGSHGLAQKYCTIRINTAQTKPETRRADASYMRKGGTKSRAQKTHG